MPKMPNKQTKKNKAEANKNALYLLETKPKKK